MKKQYKEGACLELGRASVPPPTRRRVSNGLRKGCEIKLLVGQLLTGAYDYVVQRFPEGEIGKVTGQIKDGKMIVLFEGEEWLVKKSDITPIESRGKKSKP